MQAEAKIGKENKKTRREGEGQRANKKGRGKGVSAAGFASSITLTPSTQPHHPLTRFHNHFAEADSPSCGQAKDIVMC